MNTESSKVEKKDKLHQAKKVSIEVFLGIGILFLGAMSLAGVVRLVILAVLAFFEDNWLVLSASLFGLSAIVYLFTLLMLYFTEYSDKKVR